jgi:hypothetical protein
MPRPGEKGFESKEDLVNSCESVFLKALENTGFRRIDDSGEKFKEK